MKVIILVCFLFLLRSNPNAQSSQEAVTPKALYDTIMLNPVLHQNWGGEEFAWHAANYGDLFVKGYLVWKDTAWLNWGIRYYELIRSHMQACPDGYIGLLGPTFRGNGLWNNEEISDALMANLMLGFSELVLNDVKLKKIYGKKAMEYVAFCKKHMLEKWDKRGLWHETGDYGDYIAGCYFVKPDDLSKWVFDDKIQINPWLSLQYNMGNCLGITNLRMYRITGEKIYREKAEKLFFRFKNNFQFFNNHYVWNYWSPFYEKDILFDSNRCKLWVNVHPYRPGYQEMEVGQIVEAYHTGVVFDSTDIRRIINTNLDVMWNKSMEHPEFTISNGHRPDTSNRNEENAVAGRGLLWSSLGDFSQTILDLGRREMEAGQASPDIRDKVQQAYFFEVVLKRPPSFQRKYCAGRTVIVKDVPFGNSPDLNYTGVIPYAITRGKNSFVVAKSPVSANWLLIFTRAMAELKLKRLMKGQSKATAMALRVSG